MLKKSGLIVLLVLVMAFCSEGVLGVLDYESPPGRCVNWVSLYLTNGCDIPGGSWVNTCWTTCPSINMPIHEVGSWRSTDEIWASKRMDNTYINRVQFTFSDEPIQSYIKFQLTDDTVGCVRFAEVTLTTSEGVVDLFSGYYYVWQGVSSTYFTLCKGISSEYPYAKVFELSSAQATPTTITGISYQEWNAVTDGDLVRPEAYNAAAWFNDEKYVIKWATEPDEDHDGYVTGDDCNDTDPTVYPGAPEICDGNVNDQHWKNKEAMDQCEITEGRVVDAGCDGDGDRYCSADMNVSLSWLEGCTIADSTTCCKRTLEWYREASGQETGSVPDVYNALLAHDEDLKLDAFIKDIPVASKLFRAATKDFLLGGTKQTNYFARGNDCTGPGTGANTYPGAAEKCDNSNDNNNVIDDNCNDGSAADALYAWDNDPDTGINEFCEDNSSRDCERYDHSWIGLYGVDADGACCGNSVYEKTGTNPGYWKTTEFFPLVTDKEMLELLLPDEYSGCWDSNAVHNNDVAGVNLFSTEDIFAGGFSNNAVLPLDEVNVTYGDKYTIYTNISLGGGLGGIAKLRYLERSLSCKIPESDVYKKDHYIGESGGKAQMKAVRKEHSGSGSPYAEGTSIVYSYNYSLEFPVPDGTALPQPPVIAPYQGITGGVACRKPLPDLPQAATASFSLVDDPNRGTTRKVSAKIECPSTSIGYIIGQTNITYRTNCDYIDVDGDGLDVCSDVCGGDERDDEKYKCICDLPYLQENEVVNTGLYVKSGEGRGVVMRNYTPSSPSVKQAAFEIYMVGVPEIDLRETKFYKTEDAKVLNVNGTFRGCDIPATSWFLRQINTFNPAPPDNKAILPMYNFKHDGGRGNDNCTVSSDYFCSLDGRWKRNVDGIEANNISTIPEAESGLLQEGGYWKDFYLEADCCPTSYCWDGFRCNNGYHGFVGVHIANASVGEDEELRDYKCVDGEWQRAYWKTDQDNFTMGYCGEYQCLYRPLDGSNKLCVNDGNYSFDDYCMAGSWSSRTNMIAKRLLNLTEGKGDYVLFCDSFENALNDYDYTDPVVGDVLEYIVGKRTTATDVQLFDCGFGEWSGAAGEGFGCTNNFCVLKYIDNGEPKVVFGTSLNFPINTTNEDFRFTLSFLRLFDAITRNIIPQDADHYTYCDGVIRQQSGDYLGCDGPYSYKEDIDWELWYNAKTQCIIYSPVKINLGETSTWDSFIEFVKKPFTSIINSILSIPGGKYYRNDYSFVSGVGKFRRLYVNTNFDGGSLGRAVKGVVETVGSETGMIVDYYKVGINICGKVEEYNKKYCPSYGDVPKEYIPILCPMSCEPMINDDGSWGFHIESNDEKNGIILWPELTSKIRMGGTITSTQSKTDIGPIYNVEEGAG